MKEILTGFERALLNLKAGYRLARKGWNGKGMSVTLQIGHPQGIPCSRQVAERWGIQEGDLFKCNPYFQIQNPDGTFSMWVPSVADLLANDWYIVGGEK